MPSDAHTVPAGAKDMSASCCDHSKQGVSQRTYHALKHLTNTKGIGTRTVLHPMRTYTDVPALHSAPEIRHAQTLPCYRAACGCTTRLLLSAMADMHMQSL